jgi:hypothetical protein
MAKEFMGISIWALLGGAAIVWLYVEKKKCQNAVTVLVQEDIKRLTGQAMRSIPGETPVPMEP